MPKYNLLSRPFARKARTFVRRTVATCAVILAVAFFTTISTDLGPVLKAQAEEQASRFMERPMRIGKMRIVLWSGSYVFEDVVIENRNPEAVPFFTAKRIVVAIPWSEIFRRRLVFDAIELTDWRMHVEDGPTGHNFPRFTPRGPRGQSSWTTTLRYVNASGGEFAFQDHGARWGIVARNLQVSVAHPGSEYVGRAQFSDGLTAIQGFVPFRTDMTSTFTVKGGRVNFDRMDLTTEGTRSVLKGDVDLARFPELMFQMDSTIDLSRARELFFANDSFRLSGTSRFLGTFHLFKETQANGRIRTGRELKGTFEADQFGLNDYRFDDLRGNVRWTPDVLRVTEATTGAYGGTAGFSYTMAPLGQPGVRTKATFDAEWHDVDLAKLTSALKMEGIQLAGRLSGRNLLEWPLRGFSEATGHGELHIAPPDGVTLMTREMPLERIRAEAERPRPAGPFSPLTPFEPVPIGGDVVYAFGTDDIEIAPSRLATQSTFVEFDGRTAYGEDSRFPFHVSSADWQESDRVFAGLLTAFGVRTRAIPIEGHGTFDGIMQGSVRRPSIEGDFSGDGMRAWDVVWGAVKGHAVIENAYVDASDVEITSGDSRIATTGRFSIGYPRRDGGEEINARIQISGRPVVDLRNAFRLYEYDLDGTLSGEFDVRGKYLTPTGSGTMEITNGTAYGEPFESARAAVQLEGEGVRLENLQAMKGGARGTGAAYVGFDGTYNFNFDAQSIPVESFAVAKRLPLPISGLLDVNAGGNATFASPRYDVKATMRDLFVADEGVGQVYGEFSVANNLMTVRQLDVASPRLGVTGSGRIALNPELETEFSLLVSDASLDPYIRLFQPRVSPYTTAVASGSIRVVGSLADIDNLLVDATVERLDLTLFDYALRNARPIRMALDRHSIRVNDLRIVGQDTQVDVTGQINLHDRRIALRTTGDANLAVLQGIFPNISSRGMATLSATLEGPLENPDVTGALELVNGRIRHFALPHALENINGPLRFDSRGVSLDGLTGRLGGGDVTFKGRVEQDGYLPGRIDVAMAGTDMRLRFTEGGQALVDAQLSLQGTIEDALLSGRVTVKDALYRRTLSTGVGFFNFGGDDDIPQRAGVAPTLPVRYDVRIEAQSSIRVRNNVFPTLVASADLRLRGTFARPLLFGRFEVDRGEAQFEGKRYVLTRGTIDFNNPTRIEPFFDIEAETRVRVPGETYRVTVRAAGPQDRLDPVLTSDPPLPEVEVLALLFGNIAPGGNAELNQYSTVITPQQQLMRAQLAQQLTGGISSEVGRAVAGAVGVDTFQITPLLGDPNAQTARLEPSARVTIVKNLSDRLAVTYQRSLSSSSRDQIILLEYDPTDRYSWILSRNEDGTFALDLRVRRTFR
jgi:hypothetical protein